MTKEQYLLMCEQMNIPVDIKEIPIEYNDFPPQVQEALQIFSILPDNIDGFSGTYFGKDFSILPYLFEDIFVVEDKQLTMKFILIILNIVKTQYSEKQKANQRKSKNSKGGIHVNG